MHLRLERWASPISPLLLVTDTQRILRALEYADYEAPMHWLLRRHYGATHWRRAQHRFPSGKPSMPILPAASTSSRASRLRLAARHSNVESGGRFRPFQREPQSATANSPANSVKTEQVGRSAPRTARIRSPLLCLVIGLSERTAGSPAMLVAFFASNGCSNMKRAFPRSRRVKKPFQRRRIARNARADRPARSRTTFCGSSAMSGEAR
jgi:hypothetical protein